LRGPGAKANPGFGARTAAQESGEENSASRHE